MRCGRAMSAACRVSSSSGPLHNLLLLSHCTIRLKRYCNDDGASFKSLIPFVVSVILRRIWCWHISLLCSTLGLLTVLKRSYLNRSPPSLTVAIST